ncbi:hypothetical protein ACLK2E_13930 [Escherichia coli]
MGKRGLKVNGKGPQGYGKSKGVWEGSQKGVGGGGGGDFYRFTIAIDVVAHELSHGVTESEAGLIYFEQSGALNESLSGGFGSVGQPV